MMTFGLNMLGRTRYIGVDLALDTHSTELALDTLTDSLLVTLVTQDITIDTETIDVLLVRGSNGLIVGICQ